MTTQCFLYFSRYKADKIWMKILVLVLLLADAVNAVLDFVWLYDTLVTGFLDVNGLVNAPWTVASNPAMVGIIGGIVQIFFAWRVKVLINNNILVLFIMTMATIALLGGVGAAIYAHFVPRFDQFSKFQWLVTIWLICTAVCDTTITISLTWHLRKHKSKFAGSNDILNRIIRNTVQNGLMTSIWAIVDLSSFLATPDTGLHLIFQLPMAKLYTNSLMSSLNSRAGWSYSSQSSDRNNISQGQSHRLDVVNLNTSTRPEVFVHVESHELSDVANKQDMEWQADPKSRVGTDSV